MVAVHTDLKQQKITSESKILGELNERFQQPSFTILQEMEDLLISSCNGVQMKPSAVVNDQQQLGIKMATSIGTVIQLNNFSKTS